jgi:hypothetical protein
LFLAFVDPASVRNTLVLRSWTRFGCWSIGRSRRAHRCSSMRGRCCRSSHCVRGFGTWPTTTSTPRRCANMPISCGGALVAACIDAPLRTAWVGSDSASWAADRSRLRTGAYPPQAVPKLRPWRAPNDRRCSAHRSTRQLAVGGQGFLISAFVGIDELPHIGETAMGIDQPASSAGHLEHSGDRHDLRVCTPPRDALIGAPPAA